MKTQGIVIKIFLLAIIVTIFMLATTQADSGYNYYFLYKNSGAYDMIHGDRESGQDTQHGTDSEYLDNGESRDESTTGMNEGWDAEEVNESDSDW